MNLKPLDLSFNRKILKRKIKIRKQEDPKSMHLTHRP